MKGEEKGSGFPLISLAIIISLFGLILYDIQQEDSKIVQTIKRYDVEKYVNQGFSQTKSGFEWIGSRIEENFPGFQEKFVEFYETYAELARNLGLIVYNVAKNTWNALEEKYPSFIKSIETGVPQLFEQSQLVFVNIWSTSQIYFTDSVNYLSKEVFVGQLSPENMQRVVIEAFNTTQQKATEYYHWLYEKVQTSIK